MKNRFLVFCFVLFSFSSCQKFLKGGVGTIPPASSYLTPTQVSGAVAAIYQVMADQRFYGYAYFIRINAPSDESFFYEGSFPVAIDAETSTDNDVFNFWQVLYLGINRANSLMDNINNPGSSVDSVTIRHAYGEALFLRSYYFFQLAQWFGPIPMPLHATTGPQDAQIARTPLQAVYNQIIADMTTAHSLLYDQKSTQLQYSERVSKTIVEGMLARVCLYAAGNPLNDTRRYIDAYMWAQMVVQSGEHSLNPSYSQIFINESQKRYDVKEAMWEVGFNFIGTYYAYNTPGTVGVDNGVNQSVVDSGFSFPRVLPNAHLYCTYEQGDYRRDWNFANYSFSNAIKNPLGTDDYWSRQEAKWRREYEPSIIRQNVTSNTIAYGNGTNFPILRYADVLLMLSEAAYQIGQYDSSMIALNLVRERSISATPIIDHVETIANGSGYTYAPPVSIITVDANGNPVIRHGSGATAQAYVYKGQVSVLLTGQGSGYDSIVPPTVQIGIPWQVNSTYDVGQQIFNPNDNSIYTVNVSGTVTPSSSIPSSHTLPCLPDTCGAGFVYAGKMATAIAYITPVPKVDIKDQSVLLQAIRDERYKELAFENLRIGDLRRWGILVSSVQGLYTYEVNGDKPAYRPGPLVPAPNVLNGGSAVLIPVTGISNRNVYLPIPYNELTYNQLLYQNSGY